MEQEQKYISDYILDYVEHLEVEGGRMPKTAENYRHYIERFVDFSGDIPVKDITNETVRKYRLWLNRFRGENGRDLSTLTQSYHLIALRGFLGYLSKREIEALSPSKIELPKVSLKQVTFLHYDEVRRLIEEIDITSEQGLRDRAIIE